MKSGRKGTVLDKHSWPLYDMSHTLNIGHKQYTQLASFKLFCQLSQALVDHEQKDKYRHRPKRKIGHRENVTELKDASMINNSLAKYLRLHSDHRL